MKLTRRTLRSLTVIISLALAATAVLAQPPVLVPLARTGPWRGVSELIESPVVREQREIC